MYKLPLVQTSMFIDLLFSLYNPSTLGTRDFSSAVSGFCQARGFGLRPKMCRPSANTETSRRTQKKTSGTQGIIRRTGVIKVKTEGNLLTASARGRGEGKIK